MLLLSLNSPTFPSHHQQIDCPSYALIPKTLQTGLLYFERYVTITSYVYTVHYINHMFYILYVYMVLLTLLLHEDTYYNLLWVILYYKVWKAENYFSKAPATRIPRMILVLPIRSTCWDLKSEHRQEESQEVTQRTYFSDVELTGMAWWLWRQQIWWRLPSPSGQRWEYPGTDIWDSSFQNPPASWHGRRGQSFGVLLLQCDSESHSWRFSQKHIPPLFPMIL